MIRQHLVSLRICVWQPDKHDSECRPFIAQIPKRCGFPVEIVHVLAECRVGSTNDSLGNIGIVVFDVVLAGPAGGGLGDDAGAAGEVVSGGAVVHQSAVAFCVDPSLRGIGDHGKFRPFF